VYRFCSGKITKGVFVQQHHGSREPVLFQFIVSFGTFLFNYLIRYLSYTVLGAGDRCCQFRISTCTVFISERLVAPLLTPATGARRRQQSLPAECGQLHCPGHGSNPDRGKCDFF
jgi:hypothetical protein